MKTISDEMRDILYTLQSGECPVCKKQLQNEAKNLKIEIHHKLADSKPNNRQYPFYMQSVLNLEMVHNYCHVKAKKLFYIHIGMIEGILVLNHDLREYLINLKGQIIDIQGAIEEVETIIRRDAFVDKMVKIDRDKGRDDLGKIAHGLYYSRFDKKALISLGASKTSIEFVEKSLKEWEDNYGNG